MTTVDFEPLSVTVLMEDLRVFSASVIAGLLLELCSGAFKRGETPEALFGRIGQRRVPPDGGGEARRYGGGQLQVIEEEGGCQSSLVPPGTDEG